MNMTMRMMLKLTRQYGENVEVITYSEHRAHLKHPFGTFWVMWVAAEKEWDSEWMELK